MTNIKLQIKEELKILAKNLRIQKNLFKSKQREGVNAYSELIKKNLLKREFRHRHIARCLLRGTPYNLIEAKVREDNKPDRILIEKYKDEYSRKLSPKNNLNEDTLKAIQELAERQEIQEAIEMEVC